MLKSVTDLIGMNFYIPGYQRGYRWNSQQVSDLLNDVNEFHPKDGGFYCLQPLVVKRRDEDTFRMIKEKAKTIEEVEHMLKGSWEVIDGQQRLTTIFIILKCLTGSIPYNLSYETRMESSEFLNHLTNESLSDKNIDFHHISEAHKTVSKWFESKGSDFKKAFAKKIMDSLKFIWYESVSENPIKVFTRLNIGKIGLTNAELIKALILNEANFNKDKAYLHQEQIALEWDKIEYTLQNNEFWLFLNKVDYNRPTRIDMIFELIHASDMLHLKKRANAKTIFENIGNDKDSTFRYFYEFFRDRQYDLKQCWKTVKEIFQTFDEWFRDLFLYHYVGFLIEYNESIKSLYDLWHINGNDKNKFKIELINKIKEKIKNCKDLSKQYELENCPKKTVCKPVLLLHNIQTAINQALNNDQQYGQQVFYKFPFHLYKIENWDVEHIDSNTTSNLEEDKHKKEWLKYSILEKEISDNKTLIRRIIDYLEKKSTDDDFKKLREDIEAVIKNENSLDDNEKNQIWNFVLLDAGTNRGYGNALFPVKRRCIIGKDQGKQFEIEISGDDFNIKQINSSSSFIPPCTKYAFLKYYNIASTSIKYWDKKDAAAYRSNIAETLELFDVKISNDNKDE